MKITVNGFAALSAGIALGLLPVYPMHSVLIFTLVCALACLKS